MNHDQDEIKPQTKAETKRWTNRNALAFAIVYMGLSIACEIVLMVIFRLRVPQDNRIIAPIILTIPPLLAAWICGYRRPKEFIGVAVLASVITLVVTVTVNKLTGIKTGLAEPIVNRLVAGFLAAWLLNRVAGVRKQGTEDR